MFFVPDNESCTIDGGGAGSEFSPASITDFAGLEFINIYYMELFSDGFLDIVDNTPATIPGGYPVEEPVLAALLC